MNVEIDSSGQLREVALRDDPRTVPTGSPINSDATDGEGYDEVFSVAEPLQQAATILSPRPRSDTDRNVRKFSVRDFLQTVPIFFTLSGDQIAGLDVIVREYSEMDIIVDEGLQLQHVYVLAHGNVDVMNSKVGLKKAFGHRRIGSITAPNVFGIDDVILQTPSEFTYHASSASTLLLIPRQQFLDLFQHSPIFANNVAGRIAHTLPAFSLFHDFCRSLFGLSAAFYEVRRNLQDVGYRLSLNHIINIYKSSGTVFHRLVNRSEIDADALQYCVRRLPSNITQTYILSVSPSLPEYIANEFLADRTASIEHGHYPMTVAVDTGKRRRCAWTIGEGGQTLVIMRDGFTDCIDFTTNLCMFVVESRKIRSRLHQLVAPSAAELLREALNSQLAGGDAMDIIRRLPFAEKEIAVFRDIWGNDFLLHLYQILSHRQDYVVHMESAATKRFAQDPNAIWSLSILRGIKKSMGIPFNEELPSDITIDIIFSCNRTLKNLFCSMSSDFKEILDLYEASTGNQKTPSSAWKNQEDRYYYILTSLLKQDVTMREAYRMRLESNGFTLMEDGHSSALIVDIINVSNLSIDDIDPSLQEVGAKAKEASKVRPHFIINVDKTFGAQIEAVLRSFLLTFGDRVRSVNLTSKAAGLTGNRGDVVLPSKLLFLAHSFDEDAMDGTRLCDQNSLGVQDVASFISQSSSAKLHSGTCLTIPGIILQNESVLNFYKIVHGCTALEMQSSYVARQLEESHRTGVLRDKLISRYLFYYDDMPLGNADLSRETPPKQEIISTIYATSRCILRKVLGT